MKQWHTTIARYEANRKDGCSYFASIRLYHSTKFLHLEMIELKHLFVIIACKKDKIEASICKKI